MKGCETIERYSIDNTTWIANMGLRFVLTLHDSVVLCVFLTSTVGLAFCEKLSQKDASEIHVKDDNTWSWKEKQTLVWDGLSYIMPGDEYLPQQQDTDLFSEILKNTVMRTKRSSEVEKDNVYTQNAHITYTGNTSFVPKDDFTDVSNSSTHMVREQNNQAAGNGTMDVTQNSTDEKQLTFLERIQAKAKLYTRYQIGAYMHVYYFPVLVPLGMVGNSLSAFVMARPHNRKISFCIYMFILGISDNCMLFIAGYYWVMTVPLGGKRGLTQFECLERVTGEGICVPVRTVSKPLTLSRHLSVGLS